VRGVAGNGGPYRDPGAAVRDAFCLDQKTVDAVIRNFTIVGEAVRHVPEQIVSAQVEIPWCDMGDMRNVIVHGYHRVDLEVIWDTMHNDLPVTGCWRIQRDQLGRRNPGTENLPVFATQFRERFAQESIELGRWVQGEPLASQLCHSRIILLFTVRMHVTTAGQPPQITVKTRTDMPQLVQNRDQFFFKRLIQEAWQIEAQQVQHFIAVGVHNPLDTEPPASANRTGPAAFKSHRG
jgi:hypothetical protein